MANRKDIPPKIKNRGGGDGDDSHRNNKKDKPSADEQKKFLLDKIARFCDKCSKPYETDDVEILQQNDYSTIVHFSCSRCKSRHLATFINPLGITSRTPVNSDLSVEELAEFAQRPSISSNELLDIHELLKKEDLTTEDLLGK